MEKYINAVLQIKDSYEAPDKIMSLLLSDNKTERDRVFSSLADIFEYDYSFDWFCNYFQDKHSKRQTLKQDFTPNSLARVLSAVLMNGNNGLIYEPSAGTGGLIIAGWEFDKSKIHPFDYLPSEHLVVCSEISNRAIPFLLLNLAIRGMWAVVFHEDTLNNHVRAIYVVSNDKDSIASFSDVTLYYKNDYA